MVETLSIEFDNSISYNHKYTIERAKKRVDLELSCLTLGRELNIQLQRNKSDGNRCIQGYDDASISLLNEEELIEHAIYLQDMIIAFDKRGEANSLRIDEVRLLSHRLTLFVLDLPMHRINIEKRRKSTQAVIKSIANLNEFFINKMDRQMARFAGTHQGLHQQYLLARNIEDKPQITEPDFEGRIDGDKIQTIAVLAYESYRELRLQIKGGQAIWGLGYNEEVIEYSRPISEGENLSIKSSTIGKAGDFILLQPVSPDQSLTYKLWVNEV